MGKKKIDSLSLNKKVVSNLNSDKIKGGTGITFTSQGQNMSCFEVCTSQQDCTLGCVG